MTAKSPERVAVFAGTFRPFTIGHADIVQRGLAIFDKVCLCVGVNIDKAEALADIEQRIADIRAVWADEPRVQVDAWSGITADYAKQVGASHLLRAVRSVKDYEYERDLADANRALMGIDTVILFADPSLAYISSSLVRDLEAHGRDVADLLP